MSSATIQIDAQTEPNKPIREVDVLIVGTGPAGTSTALHLIQQDPSWAKRMVMVDKAVHPREKLCGGGITHLGEHVLARLGLAIEPPNFEVREVRLVYDEEAYSFRGNPVFRIVHRAEFDHWFMEQARARGVQVNEGETVLDVVRRDEYVEVVSDKAVYRAQVLVAADGSRSRVRAKLKWDDVSRVSRLIEVLTPETPQSSWEFRDGVAVFDFSHMTDRLQGYYWDFPSMVDGKMQMNRGVFDSRTYADQPKADLKETLRVSMAMRGRDLDAYQMKGHPIRWFDARGKFAEPRVLLAGDAAGADPLFGEGIAIALGYGAVAARAVTAAFVSGDFRFRSYRRRILTDRLLWHMPLRVFLARIAYLIKSPAVARWGWRVARVIIGLTPWRNPRFVPAKTEKFLARAKSI